MSRPAGVLGSEIQQVLAENVGALAAVQGSIVSASENRKVQTILVTSCNRGEGKTVTAIGMASSLANQANAQVLLVDCNISGPKIHEHFGLPQQPGFLDYLATDVGLEDVVCPTDDPRLMILPLGGSGAMLLEVLRSQNIARRLASLKDKFDYVICDGSAVFSSSDASIVASHFDGIVLVVQCERTRWEVVQDGKERLAKAGGKILGVALNKRRYYIPQAIYAGG
ncbi:MAG: CpsD/CapB family tyrosine-protein kinase [Candidatus Methylomirabilia bacterium]